MLSALLNGIFWCWDKLHIVLLSFKTLFDKIFSLFLLKCALFVGILKASVTYVTGLISKAYTAVVSLFDGASNVEDPFSHTTGIMGTLETANYVFPLSEMFAMLALIAGLWVACLVYRFIKSLIPTLS